MKTNLMKLMLTLGLLIASLGVQAQEKQFEKYSDVKGVQYVFISKAMLKLAGNMAAPKVPGVNMKGIVDKLTAMQIISSEEKEQTAKLKADALYITQNDKYELLMQIDDDGDKIRIFIKEGKSQSHLLMLMEEDGEIGVFILSGTFKKKDLEALSNMADNK